MSSRKDLIKRSLGITEYPWSSDDELEAAPQPVEEPSLLRTPRISVADAPGGSGLSPLTPQQHQQEQIHQTQQQQSQQHDQNRRSQARQARDLIWSIINTSDPAPSPNTRSRNDIEYGPVQSVFRGPLGGRGAGQRARDAQAPPNVQRIMEFKRLTRNIGSLRHRSILTATGVIPVSRGNPGTVVPSEANSSIVIHRHVRPRARPRSSIPLPCGRVSPVGSRAPDLSSLRRWEGLHVRARDARATPEPLPAPVLVHSDEEDAPHAATSRVSSPTLAPSVSLPTPPTTHPESHRLPARDEGNTPDTSIGVAEGSNVTLEEEIVAIELDSNDVSTQIAEPEEGRASTPAAPDVSGETELYASEIRRPAAPDETVAAASGSTSDAARTQPIQGTKRKHDADDNVEPGSVTEFNQSLLRLLECPVCLEWMEPPMAQCRRGHLVCARCRGRLASCPVCRTTFSSVRNRAMEGVAELVRYPCRHGCGKEVRLRRRAPHESSCAARHYHCPAPLCADAPPLPRGHLARHFQSQHLTMMKIGRRHKFSMKVNSEQHDTWLIRAMDEYFFLRIDVDIRTWGVVVYVSYIGPKCDAKNYTYEVTINGQHNQRKLVYCRATHSDLESSTLNVSRQDCFHLTLDQALNFIRFKNRHCDAEKFLEFNVEISKIEKPAAALEESDS